MKSLFITLLWRVGIGFFIAIIGIVLSLIFHNWQIDKWFTLLGFLCFVAAALPYTPGAKTTEYYVNMRMKKGFTDSNRRDIGPALNYSITMVLIGLVNVIVPTLVYHFIK